MTSNPLSRTWLESALILVQRSIDAAKEWNLDDQASKDRETIQAALEFLLNPEPTEAMKIMSVEAGFEYFTNRAPVSDPGIEVVHFKAMIAERTKDV